MESWREARRQQPRLFDPKISGVYLIGQKEATEDEVVCCMISDICWEERQDRPCIVSVDMFGGEHTETTRERKFANLQPGHTVGPRQRSSRSQTSASLSSAKTQRERSK